MFQRKSGSGGGRCRTAFRQRIAGLITACAALAIITTAQAQSSRPGWGSTPYHDALGTGVTFRVWAPNATSVFVPGQFNNWSTTATPLGKDFTNGVWDGAWSADVAAAVPGQQYKYYINYSGGSVWKHDPRARMVVNSSDDAGANDIIYDPTAFNWLGDSLTPPALADLVVYELHIGAFYDPNSGSSLPGKFTDATNRLDYLRSLGVSAVEALPIAEFPGYYSWGYNPADPYAADNYAYGGPDGFKTFVKACHARGIAVLLDVVHNHYGPTDLDLWDFDGWTGDGSGGGIYFYQEFDMCCTPYGSRPNYTRQPARDYIQQNFQMWLDECHVDGFRWDTPGLMMNDGSTFINDAATLISTITGMVHTNYPGRIDIAEDVTGYGFDSTWDLNFHNYVTPQLADAADASRDMTAIAYAVTNNTLFNFSAGLNRVVFLESHDIVGDLNNGVRLPTAIDTNTPDSYRARKLSTLGAALTFTSPGVPMFFEGQEMLENQQFSSSRPVDWTKTNTYSRIVLLYHDLIRLRRNLDGDVPGLKGDQCSVFQMDNFNKLVAYRRWQSGATAANQDAIVVANFAGTTRSNYTLSFPRAGNWYVHFNSDSTNYGTDYGNVGTAQVTATGTPATVGITIGPYSALVLSQLPWPPQITLSQAGGGVTVSWPIAYAGWVLDSSRTLAGTPSPWVQVPTSQYQTNATTFFINSTQPAANMFYRLRFP
jgi:1,4-alpha-glucan branching enzyme